MGRRAHSKSLVLWANGQRVGRWTLGARGETQLQYDSAWQSSELGRPLSLSLPFNLNNEPLAGPQVANYFDNLLPDSTDIRKRVATRFRTGSLEPFELLRAIGRECVGAVQLLAQDEEPAGIDQVDATEFDDAVIERHLLEVVTPNQFAQSREPDDDCPGQ